MLKKWEIGLNKDVSVLHLCLCALTFKYYWPKWLISNISRLYIYLFKSIKENSSCSIAHWKTKGDLASELFSFLMTVKSHTAPLQLQHDFPPTSGGIWLKLSGFKLTTVMLNQNRLTCCQYSVFYEMHCRASANSAGLWPHEQLAASLLSPCCSLVCIHTLYTKLLQTWKHLSPLKEKGCSEAW